MLAKIVFVIGLLAFQNGFGHPIQEDLPPLRNLSDEKISEETDGSDTINYSEEEEGDEYPDVSSEENSVEELPALEEEEFTTQSNQDSTTSQPVEKSQKTFQ